MYAARSLRLGARGHHAWLAGRICGVHATLFPRALDPMKLVAQPGPIAVAPDVPRSPVTDEVPGDPRPLLGAQRPVALAPDPTRPRLRWRLRHVGRWRAGRHHGEAQLCLATQRSAPREDHEPSCQDGSEGARKARPRPKHQVACCRRHAHAACTLRWHIRCNMLTVRRRTTPSHHVTILQIRPLADLSDRPQRLESFCGAPFCRWRCISPLAFRQTPGSGAPT
jgi:hypothetical protein